MSDYIAEIQSVFLKLHGCEATYVESVPVVEEFQGKTIWQGDVKSLRSPAIQKRHADTVGGTQLRVVEGVTLQC
jgi:hypothetical protein